MDDIEMLRAIDDAFASVPRLVHTIEYNGATFERTTYADTTRIGPGITFAPVAAPAIDPATAERAKILAALQSIKPMEQPYTRRDWALEQRGEQRMWERVIALVEKLA